MSYEGLLTTGRHDPPNIAGFEASTLGSVSSMTDSVPNAIQAVTSKRIPRPLLGVATRRYLGVFLAASVVVIAAALVTRIALVILTSGGNCLTNDYQYFLPSVVGILFANSDLSSIFKHCFTNAHFMLLPCLGFCLNASLFEWNVRIDAIVGLVLAVIRCFVLCNVLSDRDRDGNSKWLVSLVVFCLTFGSTALSCFDFGQASLTGGIGMLIFSVGLWGATRYGGTTRGDLLMILCGVLTAVCAGYWPAVWLSFIVVLLLQKVRRPQTFIAVAIGLVLSAMPTVVSMQLHREDAPNLVSVWNWTFLINSLGRCFANRIGQTSEPLMLSELSGWWGVVAIVLFAIIAPLKRETANYRAAIGLSVFGLASLWMTSLFRVGIAPWYAGFAVYVWIGILSLAVLCIASNFSEHAHARNKAIFKFVGIVVFASCAGLYLVSNISFHDKDFWADTRAEVSDSTVRNYLIAPTYSERTVFLGHIGDFPRFVKVAKVLNERCWSACSHNQTWSLQGDFILPTVTVTTVSPSRNVCWIRGEDVNAKKPFSCPEHLNLFLPSGATLDWHLNVPQCADSVVLKTSAKLKTPCMITISKNGRRVYSKTLNGLEAHTVDLAPWVGSSIDIAFQSASGSEPAVFGHPQVLLKLGKDYIANSGQNVPSNTDGSPFFPKSEESDIVLPTSDAELWQESELVRNPVERSGSEWVIKGAQPKINLKSKVAVSTSEFSHFVFNLRVDEDVPIPRAACVGFVVNDSHLVQKIIPLLPGGAMHGYSYELRLLELEPNDRITGLELLPVYVRKPDESFSITMGDIRFIKSTR